MVISGQFKMNPYSVGEVQAERAPGGYNRTDLEGITSAHTALLFSLFEFYYLTP